MVCLLTVSINICRPHWNCRTCYNVGHKQQTTIQNGRIVGGSSADKLLNTPLTAQRVQRTTPYTFVRSCGSYACLRRGLEQRAGTILQRPPLACTVIACGRSSSVDSKEKLCSLQTWHAGFTARSLLFAYSQTAYGSFHIRSTNLWPFLRWPPICFKFGTFVDNYYTNKNANFQRFLRYDLDKFGKKVVFRSDATY